MKNEGIVRNVKENVNLFVGHTIIVDCGEFSFEVPYHLGKTYYIGRKVSIEVNPK